MVILWLTEGGRAGYMSKCLIPICTCTTQKARKCTHFSMDGASSKKAWKFTGLK